MAHYGEGALCSSCLLVFASGLLLVSPAAGLEVPRKLLVQGCAWTLLCQTKLRKTFEREMAP